MLIYPPSSIFLKLWSSASTAHTPQISTISFFLNNHQKCSKPFFTFDRHSSASLKIKRMRNSLTLSWCQTCENEAQQHVRFDSEGALWAWPRRGEHSTDTIITIVSRKRHGRKGGHWKIFNPDAVRFTSPYSHSVSSTHPVTLRDEGDMHRAPLIIRVPLHSLTLLIESLLALNSC